MNRRAGWFLWAMGLGCGAGFLVLAVPPAAARDIGSATKAFNIVEAQPMGSSLAQQLVPGASVALGERVATGERSAATFLFQDDTELSLGASSKARFTHFTFNPASGASHLTLDLAPGVFRFATGAVDKTDYTIHTPDAAIGGHGAVFDILIAADGATTVLVDDGDATVTAHGKSLTLAQGWSTRVDPGQAPLAPYRSKYIAPAVMAMNMLLTESDPVLPGVSAADRVAADQRRSVTTVSGLRVPPSRVAALAGSLNGTSDGLRALQAWMDAAGGEPNGVSARAIDLIEALSSGRYGTSIDTIGAAGDRISKAARASLNASYILRAGVAPDFALPGTSQGFLFGPKGMRPVPGFTLVTPKSSRIAGNALTAFLHKGKPPLMGNGLAGVVNFSTPLADGHYRLILWTNGSGGARDQWLPFGQEVMVNGTPYRIAAAAAGRWPGTAVLGSGAAGTDRAASKTSAGAVLITTDVSGGILNINFGAASHTFLAALIVEPAADPNLVHASGAAADILAGHDLMTPIRLNAMAAVDAALGEMLTRFILMEHPAEGAPAAPAAGAARAG